MATADVKYKLTLDTTAFTKALHAALLANAGKAPTSEQPIGAALLGAAAAAVMLPQPVSRRRLLFPWLRG